MRGYTCPVFRNLSEKWALTVQAAQPPLSRPPPHTLGVSWSLGSPHGKRAQETSDNNWGEAESEGAERDVPEPHVDKMGRPLPDATPLPLARPAAFASWVFPTARRTFLRSAVQDASFLALES